MRSIWQRSRMIAIAVVSCRRRCYSFGSTTPDLQPVLERGGNAAALRSSSPAITAEAEP